jgi:hypothetical protein
MVQVPVVLTAAKNKHHQMETKVITKQKAGNTKKGKYHSTVDLLFDWFGLVCFANKNKNCQLLYS